MQSLLQWWQSLHEAAAWEWISDVVTLTGISAIAWTIWHVLVGRLKALAEKTITRWDDIIWPAIDTPLSVLIWLWPASHSLEIVVDNTLGNVSLSWLTLVQDLVVIWVIIWVLLRLVNSGEQVMIETSKRDHTTINTLGNVLRALFVCFGVLSLLKSLGVSVSGLLTVGVSGV